MRARTCIARRRLSPLLPVVLALTLPAQSAGAASAGPAKKAPYDIYEAREKLFREYEAQVRSGVSREEAWARTFERSRQLEATSPRRAFVEEVLNGKPPNTNGQTGKARKPLGPDTIVRTGKPPIESRGILSDEDFSPKPNDQKPVNRFRQVAREHGYTVEEDRLGLRVKELDIHVWKPRLEPPPKNALGARWDVALAEGSEREFAPSAIPGARPHPMEAVLDNVNKAMDGLGRPPEQWWGGYQALDRLTVTSKDVLRAMEGAGLCKTRPADCEWLRARRRMTRAPPATEAERLASYRRDQPRLRKLMRNAFESAEDSLGRDVSNLQHQLNDEALDPAKRRQLRLRSQDLEERIEGMRARFDVLHEQNPELLESVSGSRTRTRFLAEQNARIRGLRASGRVVTRAVAEEAAESTAEAVTRRLHGLNVALTAAELARCLDSGQTAAEANETETELAATAQQLGSMRQEVAAEIPKLEAAVGQGAPGSGGIDLASEVEQTFRELQLLAGRVEKARPYVDADFAAQVARMNGWIQQRRDTLATRLSAFKDAFPPEMVAQEPGFQILQMHINAIAPLAEDLWSSRWQALRDIYPVGLPASGSLATQKVQSLRAHFAPARARPCRAPIRDALARIDQNLARPDAGAAAARATLARSQGRLYAEQQRCMARIESGHTGSPSSSRSAQGGPGDERRRRLAYIRSHAADRAGSRTTDYHSLSAQQRRAEEERRRREEEEEEEERRARSAGSGAPLVRMGERLGEPLGREISGRGTTGASPATRRSACVLTPQERADYEARYGERLPENPVIPRAACPHPVE